MILLVVHLKVANGVHHNMVEVGVLQDHLAVVQSMTSPLVKPNLENGALAVAVGVVGAPQ
jgi:hypothetical protein